MTDPVTVPDAPGYPPRRAVELDPEAQRDRERREAALDADLNVARMTVAAERIAAALSRIADLLVVTFEPEPDSEERTGEPEPEPPIDEWHPVKGGRALLPHVDGTREAIVVDRIFKSEGETWAVAVSEAGYTYRVRLDILEPPR